jgi:hypothetical protein
LGAILQRGFFVVMPAQTITRVYRLDFFGIKVHYIKN